MLEKKTTLKKEPNRKTIESSIKATMAANNLYTREDIDHYDKIARFGYINPYEALLTSREYLFFTKPDLHICIPNTTTLNPELANMTIFSDAAKRYPKLLPQLQYSINKSASPFSNILTNSVKSNLDLPQINANSIETASNIYGTYMTYRQSSARSDNNYEFTLEFEDTKYLEVYMYFKLFDEYERKKYDGTITPPDISYIMNKVLHDQMSVYKIVVGEDMETILYYAKLWGVYPTSVPRDAFSDLSGSGGSLRFSVSFTSQFIEDSNPRILQELNLAVASNLIKYKNDIPIYNTSTDMSNSTWVNIPHIVKTNVGIDGLPNYKLKWR